MHCKKEKLILFTRYPVAGKTKTRLIPELGREDAARLQEIMTGYAVLNARCYGALSGVQIEICYDGASKRNMHRWLGNGLEFIRQGDGDLGQRMNRAFDRAFQAGYECVVIMGCDCPQIDVKCLSEAFDALKENDVTIGPAMDGGYYLIGLSKPVEKLFADINWGSEFVFDQTLAVIESEKLKVTKLEKLSDVDCPEDLTLCCDLGFLKSDSRTISVIIAALNEKDHIQKTVSIALQGVSEVIVADGGSLDETLKLAQQSGAQTINVPYGRPSQLNTAALQAKGDILLFLHADTELPDDFAMTMIKAVKSPKFAAGAFRLGIDSKGAGIRVIEAAANLRSRLLKLPYGDQAVFMTKDTFFRVGGFSDMPIMEDYELIKRLQKRGRIITLDKQVKTSARRWLQLGILRTTVTNQFLIAGYKLGISPMKLAVLYRNHKKRHSKNTKRKDPKNESTILRAE
ncbi:MAG: DUF2064 domain-containing protein [Planctomycetes bacterium]|nr:DUF2064 domain-containing protein [Planctomycetota bacterium]